MGHGDYLHSLAIQRMVLDARLNRIDDARRYWDQFRAEFTNPDPGTLRLVDEAREVVEKAERGASQ